MQIEWLGIVVVALLAVVVAFLVPVLLQLRRTLTSAEQFLDTTGKRLDHVLDEASGTLARLNRLSAELDSGVDGARALGVAAGDLAKMLGSLRMSLPTAAAVGTALGPALVAVAQALLSRWLGLPAAAPAAGPGVEAEDSGPEAG